ncbi:MAG: SpoIIE family protein phosphatase [Lachnospiraceae bacterium]|nr:SpoIIE family protein phosphatase [Lachnospiraceae bacterium]
MNAEILRHIPTIAEFFKIKNDKPLAEGTRQLLEAMEEKTFQAGQNIVTVGADSSDGMYIILSGNTDVLSNKGERINVLGAGDFIGELGLINDDVRGATVRATTEVVCANISRDLFEEIASKNRKIYGSFMNMLYTKTTKLVTEQQRIKSELAIATTIQDGCLEHDFSEFNKLSNIELHAAMRPAKEVGGDFYDVFMIDRNHLCFLIADVSGKGVPAALFMTMAKTHIKNFASVGMPLSEVMFRANNALCYKNEQGMFVTAFVCVMDLDTGDVTYVNAGHNPPFVKRCGDFFGMMNIKANLVLGMMEEMKYKEEHLTLSKGDTIYMYTDGVTEALNPKQEFLGDDRLGEMLNAHSDEAGDTKTFVEKMFEEVDGFADGEQQADDITMLYLSRM